MRPTFVRVFPLYAKHQGLLIEALLAILHPCRHANGIVVASRRAPVRGRHAKGLLPTLGDCHVVDPLFASMSRFDPWQTGRQAGQ